MILIISHPADDHAVAVRAELTQRGVSHAQFDLGRFPLDGRIAMRLDPRRAIDVRLTTPDGDAVDARDVRAVWWRRPQPFMVDPAVTDLNARRFALMECHEAVSGLWLLLEHAAWMNHPLADERANRKVHQLDIARAIGLDTPDTLVTNDPDAARTFVDDHGDRGVIYKAFTATPEAWRETRLLRDDEHGLLDAVRHAPVIFQSYIPAVHDLRIIVAGDTMHAAAIHSQETGYHVDCRMELSSARMTPETLPDEVAALLRTLMQRLDLRYGAIDMRRTPDGRYVFLEVNPAGQWRFVEQGTGQPITAAVTDALQSMAAPGANSARSPDLAIHR